MKLNMRDYNMKTKNKKIKKVVEKILPVLKKYKVKRAGLFGSYVREKQTKNSDVDILIEFEGSLLDLIGMEIELKKMLKRKIDLLTYKGISHLLKKQILDEELRII